MESKYYIPDISEFHHGFEYEFKEKNSSKWIKCMLNMEFSYKHIREELDDGLFRIKYLCQEDIESLGFISNRPYDGEYRSRSNIRWDCRAETLKLTHNDENNWIELRIDANYGQEYLFQGTIKNKSELKVILKQIGYESTEKS